MMIIEKYFFRKNPRRWLNPGIFLIILPNDVYSMGSEGNFIFIQFL